jgi:uncharacterized protein YceH (UPF0502 family)
MKFEHLLTDKLSVDSDSLAVLCVLMLRGPQTVGEIKTRTGRIHEFASLSAVEATLTALAQRSLVAELPRRPGQKETRYAQLLSPLSETATNDVAQTVVIAHEASEPESDRVRTLEASVEQLRAELADLKEQFDEFKRQFG